MIDRLMNQLWRVGIRTFRLLRRANLSVAFEPLFVRVASVIPTTSQPQVARLPGGATLWMPAGYRDTRTVKVGLFQEAETKLFMRILRPGMTFIDVGAYAGYFTV